MNFIRKKDLGFEKERILVLPFGDPRARQIYLSFKQELSQVPDVLSASASLSLPGGLIDVGAIQPEGRPEGEDVLIDHMIVDHDFISTLRIAIVIACLGLFGLASFTAEVRRREIGVRKVFGATVTSVIMMLSRDFSRLILLANVIAWPIAFIIMTNWLQNFAYRTNIPFWIYLLASGISMVIALVTVIFQAFRAATRNPVDSLRYE